LTRATRVGLALAGVSFVVLVASGAWLWWNYRPGPGHWIRVVHQVAAALLLVVAVALCILSILRRRKTGMPGVVAAIGVFVTVGAAYVLGRLLPWERLALHRVTIEVQGVTAAFPSDAVAVVVDGRGVAPSTYEVWAYAHLVLSVLVVAALVMVWLRSREREVSRPRPQPAQEPQSAG
jgi:hypothetical protein